MSETRSLDVLAMGRSCIDLYAHETGVPLTGVSSFDAYVGGCPTNVSVGARRLGLRTGLLTAVGEDEVGDFVLAFLRREGVDVSFVPRKAGRRTSAVIASIEGPQTFQLTFYRDNCADSALAVGDVVAAPIDATRALFVTGTGLSREPSRTATMLAAERAREAGALVVTDVDYRPDQWPSASEFGVNIRALLRLSGLGIGTEEEACAATGIEDPDAAVRGLLEERLEIFVLKRGGRGCTIWSAAQDPVDVPPFEVEPLNSLGAGDAFASGFLYGQLQGWSASRSARLGNAVGAIVVSRHGCANFMPSLAEVEAFIETQGGW